MDIRIQLKNLAIEGPARGRQNGKLVFVWGGLPDEEVTCRIIRRRRHTWTGVLEEIHSPSPWRTPPGEDHYLSCSPWQVLDYEHEPAFKESLVRQVFQQQGLALPGFAVVSGPPLGYRNKLEFSFTDTPQGAATAFFQRGAYHTKTPTSGCLLGSAAINQAAQTICQALREAGASAESLKSLMLRSNQQGQVVAGLYARQPIARVADRVAEKAQGQSPITGFRVYLSNPQSPAAVVDDVLEEWGSPILEETVLRRRFRFCDRSFFQVNVPLFERALADIARYMSSVVTARDLAYDLYAGVGVIGASIGAERRVFVESEEQSASFLRENCRLQGVTEAEIHQAPAEKAIREIPSEATLILDPPRSGVHPKILKRLAASPPRRIVYLSCNPAAQARDLALFIPYYEMAFFRAYNFFPRTPHLETLAILERRMGSKVCS